MPENYIAIDNVCAWPNLTMLPDGTILALVHNQPCHAGWEGDVECWASADGGRCWGLRSTVTVHEPGTTRMNIAAGLADNGDVVMLVSGWTGMKAKPQPRFRRGGAVDPATGQIVPAAVYDDEGGDEKVETSFRDRSPLHIQVCRSSDSGHTWARTDTQLEAESVPGQPVIPFGDVLSGSDGALYASGYAGLKSFFLRGDDDGRAWSVLSVIGQYDGGQHSPPPGYTETAPFHLGDGRWVAAARTHKQKGAWKCLHQYRSDDDGATWRFDQSLSQPQQIPAHYLRLADSRILLAYGMRSPKQYGVAVRISDEEGRSWNAPFQLVSYPDTDGGYPASVQNADGSIATAYYCASQPLHNRYHMGVVIWRPDELVCKGWSG